MICNKKSARDGSFQTTWCFSQTQTWLWLNCLNVGKNWRIQLELKCTTFTPLYTKILGHHKKAIKKQRIGNALIESSFSLRCKVWIEENTPLNFFSKHLHTFEGFLGIAVAYTIKNPRVFISNRSKENLFQSREEFLFEAWNFIVTLGHKA